MKTSGHRFAAFLVAALLGPPWSSVASAGDAAGFDAARPAGMDEADWRGLKAAMIGISGPYTQQGELLPAAGGRGYNYFGTSIALSGNRAVVGAPGDYDYRGSAYVLERDASGRWRQVAQLLGSDGAGGDGFGTSVAISGTRIAVGAPEHDVDGRSNQGKAYVFVRDGSGAWSEEAKFTTADAGDRVGTSVALQGDTLVIGAPYANDDDAGGVLIYNRSGTSWSIQASLRPFAAPDPPSGDRFGAALALDGDRLLVGMPGEDTGAANRGSAYTFVRQAGLGWQPEHRFQPAEAVSGEFGHSVALAGSLIAVGMPRTAGNKGVVQTFRSDSLSGWLPGALLRAPEATHDQWFGYSVALSGATLVVGAARYDLGEGDNDKGALFVYTTTGLGQWPAQATLKTRAPLHAENAGWAVAIDGDTVLTGAPRAGIDFGGRGRVQSFARSGTTWSERTPLLASNDSGQGLGYAVALSGGTAVVTAPGQPSPYGGSGVVNVYVRGPEPGTWHWQAALPYPNRGCSWENAVAIEGDTLIIGLPCESFLSHGAQGTAHVYVRTGADWNLQAVLIDLNGQARDYLGQSVALSGNTAVVGAPGVNGDKGAGYVFLRSGTNWSLQQRLIASDGAEGDFLGWSAAVSGDALVLGAPYKADGTGAAYVSVRSGTAWSALTRLTVPAGAVEDYFGWSVALSGDTAMVGAPWKDGIFEDQGAVHVFTRGPGWPLQTTLSSPAAALDGDFGYAVALAGKTAVVGEPGRTNAVHMFSRQGATWTHRGSARDEDTADDSALGASVAVSGTLVITGAPGAGPNNGGRAWILADDALFADGFEIE